MMLTVMVAVAESEPLSAETTMFHVPPAVGVPSSTPGTASQARPDGRLETVYIAGTENPDWVKGVVGVMGVPTAPSTVCVVGEIAGGAARVAFITLEGVVPKPSQKFPEVFASYIVRVGAAPSMPERVATNQYPKKLSLALMSLDEITRHSPPAGVHP
jgi:hypothetical protein